MTTPPLSFREPRFWARGTCCSVPGMTTPPLSFREPRFWARGTCCSVPGMTTIHKIRLGVVGLGRAFTLMLPTFIADERIELAGAADSRLEARRGFESDFGARAYDSIEPLCNDSSIEAI